MRPEHLRFQETGDQAPRRATRRGFLLDSAKLAGGGAIALALAGARLGAASAQDDGGGGGGGLGGGGRRGGGGGGGGRRQADGGGQGGQGGALPGVGVGSAFKADGNNLPGLIGVAAAGAAAAAIFTRRASRAEESAQA